MSFHFLDGVSYGPYVDDMPGTIDVDPSASIFADSGRALTLNGGAYTVTVDGGVTAIGGAALHLTSTNAPISKVTVGVNADIDCQSEHVGINAEHATNITNAGRIESNFLAVNVTNANGGDYRIENLKTGVMAGDDAGLFALGLGTHAIVNAGTISGALAIIGEGGVEKVTNYGLIDGDVFLGGGNDVFTNFKNGGKAKDGTVDGTIRLHAGDDVFKGGGTREVVSDGLGKDVLKFGGGHDHWIGLLSDDGDPADRGDGGKGIDAYDASGSETVGAVINLDKVAHTDVYFIRDVAANTADDLNNAATAGDIVLKMENAYGTTGADSIFGIKGANELVGGGGADDLFGLAGKDRLIGGDGIDYLIGGRGRDELWGGADGDLFIFDSLKDSGPTAATRDTIMDFEVAVDDIDLRPINDTLGGAIEYLGTNVNFAGNAGDLRAVWVGDRTILQLDKDGDQDADFSVALAGNLNLTIGDFLL